MRQDNQPVTHGNCTPQTLSPRGGPRLGTETERRGPALREAVVDRGEGRSGRCHRGGGSDVFIRGARPDAALPASSGRVLSSSQGPWGSQVVTPIYRQTESEEQWALRLGPEHRQVASGTLVSRRAQHDPMAATRGQDPARALASAPTSLISS